MMMSLRNMKTGMKKIMIDFPNNKVKMLQFPKLSEICNISHFVTTRHGGVSKGTYASFNPGEYCGDDNEDVLINRFLLSEAITKTLVWKGIFRLCQAEEQRCFYFCFPGVLKARLPHKVLHLKKSPLKAPHI